jgi:hypothetical protein
MDDKFEVKEKLNALARKRFGSINTIAFVENEQTKDLEYWIEDKEGGSHLLNESEVTECNQEF